MKKTNLTLINNNHEPKSISKDCKYKPSTLVLLGVGGLKRAGKDSVCDLLVKHHDFEKIALAANLRIICHRTFGVSIEEMVSDDLKEKPFKKPIELTERKISELIIRCFKEYPYLYPNVDFEVYHQNVCKNGIFDWTGTKFLTPRHMLQIVGTELIRNCIRNDFHISVVTHYIHNKCKDNERLGLNPPKISISDCRFPDERYFVKAMGGNLMLITSPTDSRDCIHSSETQRGKVDEYDFHYHNVKEGLDKLEVNFLKFLDSKVK